MKKAVKIVGIVYIPLLIISFFAWIYYGSVCTIAMSDSKILNEVASQLEAIYGVEFSLEYVASIFSTASILFFIYSAFIIVGLVIDIMIVIRSNKEDDKYPNASWIVLGALEIVFGALVEGILAIIYGATNKKKTQPSETIQEVHFEEKKEESNKPNPSDYDAPDHLE